MMMNNLVTDISTRKQAQEKRVHGPARTEGRSSDIREHRLQEESRESGAEERGAAESAGGAAGRGDARRAQVTATDAPAPHPIYVSRYVLVSKGPQEVGTYSKR